MNDTVGGLHLGVAAGGGAADVGTIRGERSRTITMRINWKEVCKFLSGAFFVQGGVIAYLAWNHVTVPLFGRKIPFLTSPQRSLVHFALCLICFYIGFIRKEDPPTVAVQLGASRVADPLNFRYDQVPARPSRVRCAVEDFVNTPSVTTEWVQQTLRLVAGIEIDAEEAARVVPWVQVALASRAALAPFDVGEVRSSLQFDPTGPYRDAR